MNTLPDAIIDCEECSKCCSARAFLMRGDDVDFFEHKHLLSEEEDATPYWKANAAFTGYVLDRPDGKCAYLEDGKCSVYDKRPLTCRAFSCVDLVLRITQYTEEQRERVKEIIDSEVYAEGKRRLL